MSNQPPKSLHLVPGISASGKSTMCRALETSLRAEGIGAELVVPHTTRPPRNGEIDGRDYFFHDHLPTLSKGWRVSRFGQHCYFNSDQQTLPNSTCPVKILPVAFTALKEVINDYTQPDVRIYVMPIVISNEVRQRWLNDIPPQRPDRDVQIELQNQGAMLEEANPYVDEVFYPDWSCLEVDKARFVTAARSLLFSVRA